MEQTPAGFSPNPQQKAFYDWVLAGSGSINIHACAGTGKTTTIVQGMRYFDGDVFFGAFNKAIANEIEFRVKSLRDVDQSRITIGTIHSAGMRAWRKQCSGFKLTVNRDKIRSMIDELGEQEPKYVENQTFLTRAVKFAKEAGFGVLKRIKDFDNWEELIEHFNLAQDIKCDPDRNELIGLAIQLYEYSLKSCKHEIDFADMLLAPLYFQSRFPKFDWILIDEAQDISPVRLAIVCKMVKATTRVVAVGDPHQAIYGFTGADSDSMDTIAERFLSSKLPLSITYRCPKVVVELAQQWVSEIQAHPTAPNGSRQTCWLKPTKQEALSEIPQTGFWELGPWGPRDVVLCRNTRPLVALAYEFLRKQIPCMVEGRDIGNALVNLATRWKITLLYELESRLSEYKEREMKKFLDLKLEAKAAQIEDQVDTLLTLIEATKESGGEHVQDLIDLIARMFGDTPEGERPKCLILSTVHKSKGREWPRVFILGRAKYMPSKWARQKWEFEQEDNLQYVAVTRTQSTLVDIIVPADWR